MTDLDSALETLRTPQTNGVAVLSEPQRLALLAHIDGEPARIAAAVAKERRKVVAYLRRVDRRPRRGVR
jgi:hypothetical protein